MSRLIDPNELLEEEWWDECEPAPDQPPEPEPEPEAVPEPERTARLILASSSQYDEHVPF